MNDFDVKNKYTGKPLFFSVLTVAILTLSLIGMSLSTFNYLEQENTENSLNSGHVFINYYEGTGISILNALPVTDQVGMNMTGDNEIFKFTVSIDITNNVEVDYEITAIKNQSSTIADNHIKMHLIKENENTNSYVPIVFTSLSEPSALGSPIGSCVLLKGNTNTSEINNYIFRMWLDYNTPSDVEGFFTVTINVYAKAYYD